MGFRVAEPALAVGLMISLQGCMESCTQQSIINGTIAAGKEGEPGIVTCDADNVQGVLAPALRCVAISYCAMQQFNGTKQMSSRCKVKYMFVEAVDLVPTPAGKTQSYDSTDLAMSGGLDVQIMEGQVQQRRLGDVFEPSYGPAKQMPLVCQWAPGSANCSQQSVPGGVLLAANSGDTVRVKCNQGFQMDPRYVAEMRCTGNGFRRSAQAKPVALRKFGGCCIPTGKQLNLQAKFSAERIPLDMDTHPGAYISVAAFVTAFVVGSMVSLSLLVLRSYQQRTLRQWQAVSTNTDSASDEPGPLE